MNRMAVAKELVAVAGGLVRAYHTWHNLGRYDEAIDTSLDLLEQEVKKVRETFFSGAHMGRDPNNKATLIGNLNGLKNSIDRILVLANKRA